MGERAVRVGRSEPRCSRLPTRTAISNLKSQISNPNLNQPTQSLQMVQMYLDMLVQGEYTLTGWICINLGYKFQLLALKFGAWAWIHVDTKRGATCHHACFSIKMEAVVFTAVWAGMDWCSLNSCLPIQMSCTFIVMFLNYKNNHNGF